MLTEVWTVQGQVVREAWETVAEVTKHMFGAEHQFKPASVNLLLSVPEGLKGITSCCYRKIFPFQGNATSVGGQGVKGAESTNTNWIQCES